MVYMFSKYRLQLCSGHTGLSDSGYHVIIVSQTGFCQHFMLLNLRKFACAGRSTPGCVSYWYEFLQFFSLSDVCSILHTRSAIYQINAIKNQ